MVRLEGELCISLKSASSASFVSSLVGTLSWYSRIHARHLEGVRTY